MSEPITYPFENPTYLGDGVYATFDGYGIWLTANHHLRSQATDEIYIEPSVWKNYGEFMAVIKKAYE